MAESSRPERLSDAEIEQALEGVPGWMVRERKTTPRISLSKFQPGFWFLMTRAASILGDPESSSGVVERLRHGCCRSRDAQRGWHHESGFRAREEDERDLRRALPMRTGCLKRERGIPINTNSPMTGRTSSAREPLVLLSSGGLGADRVWHRAVRSRDLVVGGGTPS